MRAIAIYLCADKLLANKTVNDYLAAKKYAEFYHKYPAPTPRDLFSKLSDLKSTLSLSANDELLADNSNLFFENPLLKSNESFLLTIANVLKGDVKPPNLPHFTTRVILI